MNTGIPRLPTPWRALQVAVLTACMTLLALYGVFMETDYGKALFFTYDEVWDIAEQQEAAGRPREAERLLRHIVAMEENRVTLRFGLFVLFAGPDYLVRAKLRLAQLRWRHGHLAQADQDYRETIAAVAELSGQSSWRAPLAEFRYAEFLAGTGRVEEARRHLARADERARSILARADGTGGPPWNEDEESHRPALRELSKEIARLQAQLQPGT